MVRRIEFAPEGRDDLRSLYAFIAEQSGRDRAIRYIERIEAFCRGFDTFPERGTPRDDLFPGLRIVGFERRVTVAFGVTQDVVTFYRFLYAGRDLATAFDQDA